MALGTRVPALNQPGLEVRPATRRRPVTLSMAFAALSLGGCATVTTPSPEARIDALMARMSVEQKVAQIVMPDISTITADDVRKYQFGTILNGGNSGPGGKDAAPAADWLALADAYWEASSAPRADGGPSIPTLWATDAVHGHNNIVGATVFPHNVGLGAANDPDLVRRIGEATAAEIAVTGIDWTFAPTIAVVRDGRWGRTYESYGQDPDRVAALGVAMVEGLQGKQGTAAFLDQRHVIATAKHFFGDGGTNGIDTGDARGGEAALIALHAAPYPPAIAAGVQSVMASFSSINGVKMHGNQALLDGLLKQRMGFDGLVVGDWNGHGQVPGCTNISCSKALLAGLDIFMVPEDWRKLYDNLVVDARSGVVPAARLDDAVRRVLRVKLRYGSLDKPRPAARALSGNYALLGNPAHRAIAREAVRKSLVLLKNDGILPIRPGARVLVAGDGADSVARQSGGWTISWQGGGALTEADFPGATSIYAGIARQVTAAGGTAILSSEGRFPTRPDVAIVVFGEQPYAEFSGDMKNSLFADEAPLRLLQKLKSQGIPTVSVFLSGRPMWMNREIAASDAFVAAWLPGSEGEGVADVLLAGRDGRPAHDFMGTLAMRWPVDCERVGMSGDAPGLLPLGHGLTYRSSAPKVAFSTACPLVTRMAAAERSLFGAGRLGVGISATAAGTALPGFVGRSGDGAIVLTGRDRDAQEDARAISWNAPATLAITGPASTTPVDVLIDYQVTARPLGKVTIALGCGGDCRMRFDATQMFTIAEAKGWRSERIPLACFAGPVGAKPSLPLEIASTDKLGMAISRLALVPSEGGTRCPF